MFGCNYRYLYYNPPLIIVLSSIIHTVFPEGLTVHTVSPRTGALFPTSSYPGASQLIFPTSGAGCAWRLTTTLMRKLRSTGMKRPKFSQLLGFRAGAWSYVHLIHKLIHKLLTIQMDGSKGVGTKHFRDEEEAWTGDARTLLPRCGHHISELWFGVYRGSTMMSIGQLAWHQGEAIPSLTSSDGRRTYHKEVGMDFVCTFVHLSILCLLSINSGASDMMTKETGQFPASWTIYSSGKMDKMPTKIPRINILWWAPWGI